jgi:lactoylglutathione lyase
MDNDLRLELYVDDIERSFAFYTNALGFDAGPSEYSTYRPIERRGIRLALQTISELDPDHPLVRGAPGVPRGLGVEIVLEVDDLDELHGRLTGLGSDVSPLKTQDWGLRDFRVLDPDGYYLRITTPPPRSPGAS